MGKEIKGFLKLLAGALRDLVPIILVIAFFQMAVLRQPFPDLAVVLVGLVLVVVGLALFVQGLEMALFPIGEAMAQALARKGSLTVLLAFAFLLGFGTTVAEPALIAIAAEAAKIAGKAAAIANTQEARDGYATGIRMTVALSVGFALVLGVFRILKGWPIHYFIIGGYILVIAMTPLAPDGIVGIAYDSGGVTTSTITVPLVTALGVGLASTIRGRNADDEFGLLVVTDIAREVLGKGRSPDRVNVYEAMSKPILTLSAEMNVVYAVRMLTRFQLTRALVVDHDRNPLGMVTLRDMVLRTLADTEAD